MTEQHEDVTRAGRSVLEHSPERATAATAGRGATDDGGQAFPVPAGNFSGGESWSPENGMSLRDYFAAHAMAGLLVNTGGYASDEDGEFIAQFAYEVADAMLKARRKS